VKVGTIFQPRRDRNRETALQRPNAQQPRRRLSVRDKQIARLALRRIPADRAGDAQLLELEPAKAWRNSGVSLLETVKKRRMVNVTICRAPAL